MVLKPTFYQISWLFKFHWDNYLKLNLVRGEKVHILTKNVKCFMYFRVKKNK